MYGTVAEADAYFILILSNDVWDNALASDKTKALEMATRAIDDLNYLLEKTVSTQELEFPRGTDTTVPTPIKEAAYESALAFLEGFDPEQESVQLGVVQNSFTMVNTKYDPEYTSEHIRAGIPSVKSWRLLFPYLVDPRNLTLSRV